MNSRRQFLRQTAALGVGAFSWPASLPAAHAEPGEWTEPSLANLAGEEFWQGVRGWFEPDPSFVNLENGFFSPMTIATRRCQEREMRRVNRLSSRYLRTQWAEDLAALKPELARLAGCDPAEIALVRNTTEAMNTVLNGLTWKPGDEVIMSDQDYGTMEQQLQSLARRHGIVLRIARLPLQPRSEDEVVSAYAGGITGRTRLMLVTHVINLSGQVLPVRQITEMAHRHGVKVLVDGAHAFAQLPFSVSELGCDFYGTSLHKWLGAPLGLGLLYIRKGLIAEVWPLFGDTGSPVDDITRFEHLGTQPVHSVLALREAIRFHDLVGGRRKFDRLDGLRSHWMQRARGIPGVRLVHFAPPGGGSALGCVAKAGLTPDELAARLWRQHRIFSVAINHPVVNGVRITPHLYTTTRELDDLVEAIAAC